MTKINRRLLSGASFAALGVGLSLIPVEAQAFVGTTINYTPPGTTITNSTGFTTSAWGGAKESITGIVVSNTGGAGDVTVIVNNSSNFFVSASAWGFKTVSAQAIGGFISATTNGGGGTAIGIVNNNSNITVEANATLGSDLANAVAIGGFQIASASESAQNVFNNNDSFKVTATASVFDNGTANATAAALRQIAFAGSTANNSISNNGSFTVTAHAQAFGSNNASANAFAGGTTIGLPVGAIEQIAIASSDASNTFVNAALGLVSVHASATATTTGFGGGANANATALGVGQLAIAGSSATNNMTNAGVVDVGAFASANAQWSHATANAVVGFAVNQVAIGSTWASNNFSNAASGLLVAHATASAANVTAWTGAFAHASIGMTILGVDVAGVQQFALASTFAVNDMTNNGTMLFSAHAFAVDPANATAEVFIHAIGQNASASDAWNNFSNNGAIGIFGTAVAVSAGVGTSFGVVTTIAGTGFAQAHADLDAVINQTAVGLSTATNNYTNNGLFVVSGNAFAAAGGTAKATATVTGLQQNASATGFAGNSFVNGGLGVGTTFVPAVFSVVANATAFAWTTSAIANATAYAFIQNATGGLFGTAYNFASNQGFVGANANALAVIVSGLASANASAWAAQQSASAGTFATNVLSNAADATILALANATALGGSSGQAFAAAWAVSQFATATTFAGNFLVNDGAIVAIANASATGFSSLAFASADASAWAISQNATASWAVGTILNNGLILASAHATAIAGQVVSSASAFAWAVSQQANGVTLATALIENNGVISAVATGFAFATDTALVAIGVKAVATGSAWAISQSASATFAFASIANHGLINANAKATAIAGDTASAWAGAWAISQSASGNANSGLATAVIVNSGRTTATTGGGTTFVPAVINAHASAFAAATGFASASAGAWAIEQSASWAGSAFASIFNSASGLINASGIVNAVAGSTASAWVGAWAVSQNVRATSGIGQALLTNEGTIHALASAVGSATFSAFATASAVGVSQNVVNGGNSVAFAAVDNAGIIQVTMNAAAHGIITGTSVPFDFSVAFASVWGRAITQSASATSFASNSVLNETGALIAITGNATAVGWTATALAGSGGVSNWIGAIEQNASAASAANFVSNNGLITANANAFASGFLSASAEAFVFGISQNATGTTFAAVNTVVNHATIGVHANASATFGTFDAASAIAYGVMQHASGSTLASNFVSNTHLITVTANASVVAWLAPSATAFAFASAWGVTQTAGAFTLASNDVFNSGTIGPVAHAFAKAFGTASAIAVAGGVFQSAVAVGFAFNTVTNSGNILATAIATAKAGLFGFASASAIGVSQFASAFSIAANSVTNSGFINASAHADAHGAVATAIAFAGGVLQSAIASVSAFNTVVNAGTINVVASASAHGGIDIAIATAVGIAQSASAFSFASNFVTNTTGAVLNVSAHALASIGNAAGFVTPDAAVAVGVTQNATASFAASNTVINNGSMHVSASAVGVGGEWANVFAAAVGIGQSASAFFAGNFASNAGNLTVLANASGSVTQDGFGAHATANAAGVLQTAWAGITGVGSNVVINSGTMIVHAHAKAASVTWSATAVANAIGVAQSNWGATLGFAFGTVLNNGGSLDVLAQATANAGGTVTALAVANAVGISITAPTAFALGLNVVNSGAFHVEADVAGNGLGLAAATGIWASGNIVFGALTGGGGITNLANMTVVADAGAAASGSAFALGIGVFADTYVGAVSNAGNLDVRAITGTGGGFVQAIGILVAGPSPAWGGTTAVGTVINAGGDIFAGISLDDGDTFYRGTAISVASAPNAMNVILSGAGKGTSSGAHIYGNIFISTDDSITVVNGNTCFNGVINQPFASNHAGITGSTNFASYPLTAPFLPSLTTAGGGIDPFVAAAAVGQLTIAASGTLVLANDPKQGAAAAYVSNYTQAGALVMEIRGTTPNGGQGGDNTVGKIVASVSANLGGSLEIIPFAGLYTDTSYAIVSAPAGSLNGTWAAVTDPSVLLAFSITNSGTVAVDQKILNVNRIAFDAVPGLTPNEAQVGHGIELTYSTTLTGDYANLVANLFQINSAGAYADALRQLSGVEYGLLVNASHTSVRMLNNTVGTHLQIIASGGEDHVGQLIKGVSPAAGGTGIGKGNLWVSAWGNWGDPDAKSSNPETRTSEQGVLVGVDFDMDNQTRLGLVAGESSGRVRFQNDYHNSAEYRGWHLGVYGRYDDDTSPWYIEGIGAYSVYTNDVTRHINIQPGINTLCCTFGFDEPSSLIAGTARGSFDSHTYSFAAEAGWNWDTGSAIDLTPFIGLSWMDSNSDTFNEVGFAGGNLHIGDATSESFASHLGVRLTTDWAVTEHMLISPVIRLEWEHEFEDDLWSVQESFAGAPAGGTFRTTGSGYADDFLNVGAALAFAISGRVDANIGYEGHFSSDEHDNAITGRVNLHW